MKALLAVLAVVGSAVGQAMLSASWPAASIFFDLPLIVVIYYAIAKGPTGALMAGTGAGLLQDALSGTLMGAGALSRASVGYLVGVLGLRFALAPFMSRILVLAAATVLCRFIEVGILAVMGRRLAYSPYPQLLLMTAGNCALGALMMGALRRESPQ